MKRLLFMLIALLACQLTWAYDFKKGDIYYTKTSASSVMVSDCSTSISGKVTIPEYITDVTYYYDNGGVRHEIYNKYYVTSIGSSAFSQCTSMTEVTIPNTVTSIGSSAFFYCPSLISVTIPNSVTWIGNSTFSGCTSLPGVIIPNTVTSIGDYAFKNCSSLTWVTIPNSVTSIGNSAFYGCSRLTKVKISSVASWCQIQFEDNPLQYAEHLYLEDDEITCLVIPDSVISISNNSFVNCKGLISVSIPKSVISIGEGAFSGCIHLETVINRSSYLNIEKSSTKNGYVGYYANEVFNCNDMEDYAYRIENGNCTITFFIGLGKKAVIPDAIDGVPVTAIASNAFKDNTDLVSVHIPASVQSIGENAFTGCTNLRKVVFAGNTVPEGLDTAFDAVKGRQTYVSSSAYDGYAGVLGNINVYSNLSSKFEADGIDYIPVPSTRTVVAFDCDYSSPILSVPSTVSYKNVDLAVSSVAPQTFRNNTALTTFSLGGDVTSIGVEAFNRCTALTGFSIEEGESTLNFAASLTGLPVATLSIGREISYETSPFKKLTSLKTLYVMGKAKTIASDEFTGCTALTTLGTAGAVNAIAENAFEGLTALSDISLDGISLIVGKSAFQGCTALNNVTIEGGVSQIGESSFAACTGMKKLTISSGLSSIGARAFYGCNQLVTLSLPSSITSFGDYAFYNCSALQSPVRISSTLPTTVGAYAFAGCSSVPSIIIGKGCTFIGVSAFKGCSTITAITLPQALEYLGGYAFANCSSLATISLPDNLTAINDYTFSNCSALNPVTIPATVTTIGASAFAGTTALGSVELPTGLTALGSHAFDGSGITSIVLPKGVTSVSEGVFANTKQLETADLNLATEIGVSAFDGSNITALTIPATVLTIGDGAFANCTSLADLNIPSGPKKLTVGINQSGEGIFHDCKLENLYIGRELSFASTADGGYSPFYDNKTLKNVHLGEKAITIPENMFAQCAALDNVTLDISVTSMGASAFKGSGVRTINFPTKLTSISNYAFQNCSRLTTVEIPEHVATIGKYAFSGSGLRTITLPATLKTIDEYVFQDTKSLQSITISKGTTTIAANAFNGSGLPTLSIPNTVTNIGNGAFYGCTKLAKLNIEDGSETLALGYNMTNEGLFADCALTSLYQGRDLKYSTSSLYGTSPFYASSTLQSVELGDIPTSVGSKQFYNCSALTTVKIGDSVTTIGDYAFSGCSNLNSFVVGASIEEIGQEAFSDCTVMEELRTYAAIPPVCGDQALSDIDKFSCTLYVPTGAASDYQSASQWNEFFFVETFDAGVGVSYIEITPTASTVNVGEALELNAVVYPESALVRTVNWSSANPSVADVNAQGIVTALAEGQTEIIATAKDGSGVTAKCLVNVIDPDKPLPYAFSLEEETISATEVTMVSVNMVNEGEITSLQCDVLLPDGLALARTAKGNYDIRKSDRLDDSFVVTSSDLDGAVRILIYSTQNYPIDGNEGAIFTLPVTVTDTDASAGKQYEITIDGISLTLLSDYSEVFPPNVKQTFTVGSTFTRGDVNNDGRFSAADVTLVVSYVLGGDPENGVKEAADVNADGRISAADVTMVVSYALSGSNVSTASYAVAAERESRLYEYASIEFVAANKMLIRVSNLETYVSAQMDIALPEGIGIKTACLTGQNLDSHVVACNKLENGMTRVLVYSLSNNSFADADNFLEIALYKTGSVSGSSLAVENVLLVKQMGNRVEEFCASGIYGDMDTTGIGTIGSEGRRIMINGTPHFIEPDQNGGYVVCDLQGRVYAVDYENEGASLSLEPGIYIINSVKTIIK